MSFLACCFFIAPLSILTLTYFVLSILTSSILTLTLYISLLFPKPAQSQLYAATGLSEPLEGLVSEAWKLLGFQGTDPSTDFRGMGLVGLQHLLYFANHDSTSLPSHPASSLPSVPLSFYLYHFLSCR